MGELCELGISALARLYRKRELSPVEVVQAHLDRCERLHPLLNATLTLLSDSAMQAARAAEALFLADIDLGPLHGIPISVKDIIRVRGTRTTAASRVLLEAPLDREDAVITRRLRGAGAVIIGKTNLHEFASGDPEPEGPFGLVQNPRRVGCHPGSSSSGAGAAVAAGLGVIAIGTDTGGSIRIPASLCGVAGIKPTTGRIPLDGIVPLSASLDTVGPLARRVSDVAVALAGCLGPQTTWPDLTSPRPAPPPRGLRVGVPRGDFFGKMQPAVAAAFAASLHLMREMGCVLIDFDPEGIEEMSAVGTVLVQAESAAYHERYRGQAHLYGRNFRERLAPGWELKATAYLQARRRRVEIQRTWLALAGRFDVIVTPTTPAVAPRHGVATIEVGGKDVPFRNLLRQFTQPFSFLGWPGLSLPNGLDAEGLPTGLQILGPPDSEARLLAFGEQMEQALDLGGKLPLEPVK